VRAMFGRAVDRSARDPRGPPGVARCIRCAHSCQAEAVTVPAERRADSERDGVDLDDERHHE